MKYNEFKEKLKEYKDLRYDKKALVLVNNEGYFIKHIKLKCRSIILVLTEDQQQFTPQIGTFMILEDVNDKDIKIELPDNNKPIDILSLGFYYNNKSLMFKDIAVVIKV